MSMCPKCYKEHLAVKDHNKDAVAHLDLFRARLRLAFRAGGPKAIAEEAMFECDLHRNGEAYRGFLNPAELAFLIDQYGRDPRWLDRLVTSSTRLQQISRTMGTARYDTFSKPIDERIAGLAGTIIMDDFY